MFGRSIMGTWARRLSAAAFLAGVLAPSVAHADVRREGDWSDDDPDVTIDLENVTRGEAVKRLASAAGWSVVVTSGRLDAGSITLHVKDQPPGKLLDVVLADGHYVARRDDKLISIADGVSLGNPVGVPQTPPVPPMPPVPAVAPVPASAEVDSGRDRFITGGNLRIEPGEVVHDITLMGGNLDCWGTVTGDISVMGGNVHLYRSAHVRGDAATVGGNLTMETGAVVDGDVGVVGGVLHREEGCRVGGDVQEGMRKQARHHRSRAQKTPAAAALPKVPEAPKEGMLRSAANALNVAALLFVFGAVLLALAPERMEKLKVQIAARPMRSFATGVVAIIPVLLMAVVACLPIITIPFVIAALLGAVLAGTCSVLETVGGALLAHRTKNPYVHLALGGGIFLLAGALPVVGGLVKLAVFFTAVGAVVSTRGAGLFPLRGAKGSPYRTTPVDA